MLLNIDNLAIAYPGNSEPTVRDVNFSLNKGEILTIVGESGSGKTSVIRAILGCLSGSGFVSEGQILFEDKDLIQYTNKDWLELRGKHISMIFQDSGNMMNPVQTIGYQFVEYLQTHSDMDKQAAWNKAVEMLALMNLPNPENILKSYIFELSGGMRQRSEERR